MTASGNLITNISIKIEKVNSVAQRSGTNKPFTIPYQSFPELYKTYPQNTLTQITYRNICCIKNVDIFFLGVFPFTLLLAKYSMFLKVIIWQQTIN